MDELWNIVAHEISSDLETITGTSDALYKQMKNHLENKLKGKTTQHGHNREQAPVFKDESTLYGMID